MACEQLTRLGDVIELEDVKREPISSRDRKDRKGSYPYYGAQGIVDYLDDYTYEGDYLLVAEDGENLRSRKNPIANAASGKFRVTNHAHVIAESEKCNLVFLRHLLNMTDISAYVTGSTQPQLSQSNLCAMKLPLPSRAEQNAIANVLSLFDRKIELNNQLNDYLANLLDAAFANSAKSGSKEFGLPEVVDILSGGTPKTKNAEYWEDGRIPFFTPGDVTNSVYTLTTEKHITDVGLDNCNSELYPVDTVFLTARGTVGKVAIAGRPMAMNQSCFAFRGKSIPQSVVFQIIKNAVKTLRAKANGATFAAINTRDLKIETVAVPCNKEIAHYDESASKWLDLIRTNEEENLQLSALRDILLPKLMSGEIDVSKVDLTQLTNNHLADY